MPDPEETDVEITVVDGEGAETKVAEDDITAALNAAINVREVVVAVGETRQLREYQPNSYHLTFKTELSGVADVITSIGDEDKKTVKKMFLSLLTAKMAGQVASMKRFIHAEMIKDGFEPNNIDWRRGEKEKVLGDK